MAIRIFLPHLVPCLPARSGLLGAHSRVNAVKGRIKLLFREVVHSSGANCICVWADIARGDARPVALPIKVHHLGVLVVRDLL